MIVDIETIDDVEQLRTGDIVFNADHSARFEIVSSERGYVILRGIDKRFLQMIPISLFLKKSWRVEKFPIALI